MIELSQSALDNNLNFIRKTVGEERRISVVVKGNGYGHGIPEVVRMCRNAGIDHFSVFSPEEAYEVYKQVADRANIMIMGYMDEPEIMEWAVERGIDFYLFEPDRLDLAIDTAKKVGKKARVHIEVETGMNRTGFNAHEWTEVVKKIQANASDLEIVGLCTHFAGAEKIENHSRIKNQIECFAKYRLKFEESGLKPQYYHTACSAAVMQYPETHMDLVRVGIMVYGFWPSPEVLIGYTKGQQDAENPLRRIIQWRSRIMTIKEVPAGEYIGYGTSYLAISNMRIAVIPVGYAYGFPRNLSNMGRVLIRGKRVGTVGIVTMNMLMADITEIPEAELGDEVILIGFQGEMEISVTSFSEMSSQLNYESLSRLPQNITRKIVE